MDSSLTFSDYIQRFASNLWRWSWLILLVMITTGALTYLAVRLLPPVYQAKTVLLVSDIPAGEQLVNTYAEIAVQPSLLETALHKLNLDLQVSEFASAIEVAPIPGTQLIEIRAKSANRRQAAEIANTLAEVFSDQAHRLQGSRYLETKEKLAAQLIQADENIRLTIQELDALGRDESVRAERDSLEVKLAQYRQDYASLLNSYEQLSLDLAHSITNIAQIEPATPPAGSLRSGAVPYSFLAGGLAFGLLIFIVLVHTLRDKTLRRPEEVPQKLGLPVLGIIAAHSSEPGQPVTVAHVRSPITEAYRALRVNYQSACSTRSVRTLLVTSPSPEDGKSSVTANLALVLAQSGQRVALVDADMRLPQLHRIIGLPNRRGLYSLFSQPQVHVNGHVQGTHNPNLGVLTSGDLPPNPGELLSSEKMLEILNSLKEQTDLVILDGPPVQAVADSAVLANRVDAVLLVLKPGATQLPSARYAVEQLRRVGAELMGVVLNDVDPKAFPYQYTNHPGYYTQQDSFRANEEAEAPYQRRAQVKQRIKA